jgi:hypothetical protein
MPSALDKALKESGDELEIDLVECEWHPGG